MSTPSGDPVVVHVGQDSDEALVFGIREASLQRRGIRLVRNLGSERGSTQASAIAALQEAVERAQRLAGPGVDVTAVLVSGEGVDSVLDAGRDAQLLVFQHRDVLHLVNALTRARGNGRALDLRPPVVCLPADWSPCLAGRPVTVGVDVPERSDVLLREALSVARERGASLRVVHTWSFPQPYDDVIVDRVGAEWDASARRDITAALARVGGAAGVPVTVDIHHADACAALLGHAAESELVVLGVHRTRQLSEPRLGRVARAMLYDCSCPVLLLAAAGLRSDDGACPVPRRRPAPRRPDATRTRCEAPDPRSQPEPPRPLSPSAPPVRGR